MLAIPSLGDQLPAQLPQPTKHAIEKKNRHLDHQLARPARLGKSNDNIDATNAASKGKERHYAYGDHLVANNPKGRTDLEWPLHFSADQCNSNSHKCTIDGCADGCTDVCSLVSTYATTATTSSSGLHSRDSPYPLSPSPGFAAFNFATVSAPADLNLIGTQHNRRYHRRNFPFRVFRRLSFRSHLLNCPFLLLVLLLFVVASALGAALPSHVGAPILIDIDHSAERVGITVDWPGEFDPPTLDGPIDFSNYNYDESLDSFGDPSTESRGRSDPAYPRFGASDDSHIDDDPIDMNTNSESLDESQSLGLEPYLAAVGDVLHANRLNTLNASRSANLSSHNRDYESNRNQSHNRSSNQSHNQNRNQSHNHIVDSVNSTNFSTLSSTNSSILSNSSTLSNSSILSSSDSVRDVLFRPRRSVSVLAWPVDERSFDLRPRRAGARRLDGDPLLVEFALPVSPYVSSAPSTPLVASRVPLASSESHSSVPTSTSQSTASQSFMLPVSVPTSTSSSLSTSVDCRYESAADYYASLEDIFGCNGSDPNVSHPSSSQVDRASREYPVSVYIGS